MFLLDYFTTDRTLVAEWRADSDAKKFMPAEIRKVLDKRGGFTQGRRTKAYKDFCKLAAHCGPFLVPDTLKAVIEELAKTLYRRPQISPGRGKQLSLVRGASGVSGCVPAGAGCVL
jgi:hypothetical protein